MKEKIIIFGASKRGEYVYKKLCNEKDIIHFCDNDEKKWGKRICGIEIISPKELFRHDCKIIIASIYSDDIKSQLSHMGLSNIYVYPSPIECLLKRIKDKEENIEDMHCLSVFGGKGCINEKFLQEYVGKLETWEICKEFEEELRNNVPKADVKIVDSFEQLNKTLQKYDMVFMDNPMSIYEDHCENFDMFMEHFKVLKEESIIVMDIITRLDNIPKEFNYIRNDMHLLCRKLFFRTTNPENISIDIIKKTYQSIIEREGFKVQWDLVEERTDDFIYYLAFKVKKINDR